MEYIKLAKLNKTFGIKGEFRAYCLTDFPEERFKIGSTYFFQNPQDGSVKPFTLKTYRKSDPFVIISFKELPSINDAEPYLGFDLVIEKERATLPEGAYHIFDLIGCKAYDQTNCYLGEVIDVFAYSKTKILRIKREGGGDIQVPFANQFIRNVDIENKRIDITVIEGML